MLRIMMFATLIHGCLFRSLCVALSKQVVFLQDVTIYEGRLTSMNHSEKLSTNPTKTLTKQQSKQPEKHLQDKYLPDCNTRIKIPTSGPLSIPMTNDYLFRALL